MGLAGPASPLAGHVPAELLPGAAQQAELPHVGQVAAVLALAPEDEHPAVLLLCKPGTCPSQPLCASWRGVLPSESVHLTVWGNSSAGQAPAPQPLRASRSWQGGQACISWRGPVRREGRGAGGVEGFRGWGLGFRVADPTPSPCRQLLHRAAVQRADGCCCPGRCVVV